MLLGNRIGYPVVEVKRKCYGRNVAPQPFLWHSKSAVTKPYQSDYIDWDKGRDGYINSPTAYVPGAKPGAKARERRYFLSIAAEERVGSLIAAGGMIWAAYVATVDYAGLWRMQIMPPGPVEICILGVLAWLHAKWRRSAKIH